MNGLRRVALGVGTVVGRSFFPFATLTIILGTFLWGPWVSLLIAVALWELAGFIA
jgi:hypothetical protein